METDRQTDKKSSFGVSKDHWKGAVESNKDSKCRHWKSGVFNVADNWSALETPPAGWTVYRKLEICPETQNQHYQVHVDCGTQQRWSAVVKWLRFTKWFYVAGAQHIKHSIEYVNKTETTAEGAKLEIIKGERYYQLHEILLVVARCAYPLAFGENLEILNNDWEEVSGLIVGADIRWINKLSNPMISKMWKLYSFQVRAECEKLCLLEEQEGGFIIEPPETEESLDSECRIVDFPDT